MKTDLVKLIRDTNTVYIDTCQQFYGDESFISYLKPIDELQEKLNERLSTIGTK
ncbi:hypothetical protein N8368_00525 [Bacteroidia bacterium]|nr:hypothetical protein [Bacteroidia bacterium]MDC1394973.1 hypothetical protein [Bacteroidia bacterium]